MLLRFIDSFSDTFWCYQMAFCSSVLHHVTYDSRVAATLKSHFLSMLTPCRQFITVLSFSSLRGWAKQTLSVGLRCHHHDYCHHYLPHQYRDNHDGDDDDCQFLEHSNTHGKAMLMAHTGVVSLPDDKQEHKQRKKRRKDGWWCNHWFENKWVWSFLRRAEEKSDSLSAWGREGISESGGKAGESLEAELLLGMVSIHTRNTKARLKKMIEEIVVVNTRNQLLKILWSCIPEAVVSQWKNLVISRILHMKPAQVFQDRLDVCSPVSLAFLHFVWNPLDNANSRIMPLSYGTLFRSHSVIPTLQLPWNLL